jgi:hypothetical protein
MMTRTGFTVGGALVSIVLFAGGSLRADGPQSFEPLGEQQQTQVSGDAAPAPPERAAAARSDSGPGSAQPDPKLEQTRLRLEREVEARRQMTGDREADTGDQRRNMRFGVGYEFRMKGRQELGFDSPGSFAGGGAGPGPGPGAGGARGFGNGRR